MAGETIITVVGNLTADPELRYTQNGLAVANFTIASTPRSFDRASNDWKDGEALFLRASVWREFAENVDIWGRRRLAYEINKKAEGIYAVVNFTAAPASTTELDRQLKLSEAVMRTKVLRAEEAIAMVAAEAVRVEAKAARAAAAPAKAKA